METFFYIIGAILLLMIIIGLITFIHGIHNAVEVDPNDEDF